MSYEPRSQLCWNQKLLHWDLTVGACCYNSAFNSFSWLVFVSFPGSYQFIPLPHSLIIVAGFNLFFVRFLCFYLSLFVLRFLFFCSPVMQHLVMSSGVPSCFGLSSDEVICLRLRSFCPACGSPRTCMASAGVKIKISGRNTNICWQLLHQSFGWGTAAAEVVFFLKSITKREWNNLRKAATSCLFDCRVISRSQQQTSGALHVKNALKTKLIYFKSADQEKRRRVFLTYLQ